MRTLLGAVLMAGTLSAASIYDFTLNSIEGKAVPLSSYKGKVVMIVNVASKCGFTYQYEGLQKVYDKYKDKGLVILGFPANNFMGQEPGSDQEIKEFCSRKYNVSFPMFSKISVKGKDQAPLYQYLTDKNQVGEFGGDISWNFNKYLVDKNGKVIARWGSRTNPDAAEVTQAIEKALQ
jgi:glutathione peroxidase